MSFEALTDPFMRAPLFAELSPLQIKTLALCADRVSFKDCEAIIHEGQHGDAAYLVMSGEVAIVDPCDGALCSELLEAGTLVGEMAMLIETEHATTVIARGPVHTLRFTRDTMHELMQLDPMLAEAFMGRIARRLRAIGEQLRAFDDEIESATLRVERSDNAAQARLH